MCEELLLAILRPVVGGGHLPRVDVHPVLALLRELNRQRHNVSAHFLTHVLGQLLLLQSVLVERGHEVCERPGHLELDLEGLPGEDEGVLVREGNEAEEAGRLGRSPLPGRAVRQRHHHRLQVRAHDLELTDRLELHRLPGQVLLGGHGVRKYVEEEVARTRRVYSESNRVVHYRLK